MDKMFECVYITYLPVGVFVQVFCQLIEELGPFSFVVAHIRHICFCCGEAQQEISLVGD